LLIEVYVRPLQSKSFTMPRTSESTEHQDDPIQSIFGASEYLGKFIRAENVCLADF
jgi:hypothetical protein